MATLSEFEELLESNISQLNMTPGEIIPAKVIDIKSPETKRSCPLVFIRPPCIHTKVED